VFAVCQGAHDQLVYFEQACLAGFFLGGDDYEVGRGVRRVDGPGMEDEQSKSAAGVRARQH
jgi:hypothetical protein